MPPVHAEQRVAWEGRTPEVPDHTLRVDAGATAGKPVFFSINGSWSRSARTPAAAQPSLFARAIGVIAALVMPALMLIGPVLAYRNVPYAPPDPVGRLLLLVFGGSQGAQFFSEVMPPALMALPAPMRRWSIRRSGPTA